MLNKLISLKLVLILLLSFVAVSVNLTHAEDAKKEVDQAQYQKLYDGGVKLYKSRQYKKAILVFKRLISTSPQKPDAYLKIAHSHQKLNEYVEADKYYEKYLKLKPDADHKAYYNHGFVNHNIRNYDKSIKAFEKAVEKSDRPRYSYYMALAMSYYGKQMYEKSEPNYTKAISIKKDRDQAYYYKAKSLEKQKKYSEAISALELGRKHNPNSTMLIEYLSWLLATSPSEKDRNPKRALKLAEIAVDFTKGSDPIQLDTLAAAYAANGDFKNAIEKQEKTINILINNKGDEDLIKIYKKRLALYKTNKPWIIK